MRDIAEVLDGVVLRDPKEVNFGYGCTEGTDLFEEQESAYANSAGANSEKRELYGS